MADRQAQAFQEAAAMQVAASQEAFAASMGQAQANQAAQLMQQAAMAGFSLCPTQAAQMAQQAAFLAHYAFAQQQAAFFVQVRVCPIDCACAAGQPLVQHPNLLIGPLLPTPYSKETCIACRCAYF